MPKEPLDFAPDEPDRPNAFDLLASVNGYFSLRYQRATNSQFSFMLGIDGYIHVANLFHLLTRSQYTRWLL